MPMCKGCEKLFSLLTAERAEHAKAIRQYQVSGSDMLADLERERAEHAQDVYNQKVKFTRLIEDYKKMVADLQQQLEEARETLKWYADPSNYNYGLKPSAVDRDAGQRAQDALEGVKT